MLSMALKFELVGGIDVRLYLINVAAAF